MEVSVPYEGGRYARGRDLRQGNTDKDQAARQQENANQRRDEPDDEPAVQRVAKQEAWIEDFQQGVHRGPFSRRRRPSCERPSQEPA